MGETESNDAILNGFRIGSFEVKPKSDQINGPEGPRHIEPRVMGVLVMLAQHQGRTVGRNELMDTVWSDTVVGDEVLNRAISLLRSAFGDDRTNPRFIRTVPRRGYELIAEVTTMDDGNTDRASALSPTSIQSSTHPSSGSSSYWGKWRPLAIGLFGLVVAVIATAVYVGVRSHDVTVAVIPFNTSTLPENEQYSGEAIAEGLIQHLTAIDEISVIARRTSFHLPEDIMDTRTMGKLLGAEFLVEGTIEKKGDRLLVTLYLIDSELGTNVWTDTVDGRSGETQDLGTKAYNRLQAVLAKRLNIQEHPLASQPQTALDEPAYRKYLQAKSQWSLRGSTRLQHAIELLEEAITLAPDFANAHLALADATAALPFYTADPVPPAFAKARLQLAKVEALDPGLKSDVLASEGMMLMREKKWDPARDKLTEALLLDPDNVHANYWYSMLLSMLGDFKTALHHIQRAQRLDPVSAVINDRLALAYLWVNDETSAASRFRKSAELGYSEVTQPMPLALFLTRTKQYAALEALLTRAGYDSRWVQAFVRGLEIPLERSAAAAIIDAEIELGNVPRQLRFGIWVLLGDRERAFRDFDDGMKSHDIEVLRSPEGAFLRDDPRYVTLLERVNLHNR